MKYNPFSFEMHKNPYPAYEYLLEREPVQYNEDLGVWVISRFEDVWQASRDAQTFSSSCGPILELEMPIPVMIAMDAPEHHRLRSLVSLGFTPGTIHAMEPDIRESVRRHLDAIKGRTSFDLINDFSAKFPMDTISSMLGIPPEDRDMVQEWTRTGMERKPGESQFPPAGQIALAKSVDYFFNMIQQRRARPSNDIVSRLVHARAKTDSGESRGLSDEELLGFLLMLVAAGYETVMRFTGLVVYNLYKHPLIRHELVNHPGWIPNAIEEFLRYDNPGQYLARIVMKDVEIQGKKIPKGAKVILLHAAAMRDPREYKDPDHIDIHRKIERQLGFGNGAHLCLGAALARVECRIALEELLQRYPDYRIDEPHIIYSHCANVRGFDCLPVIC